MAEPTGSLSSPLSPGQWKHDPIPLISSAFSLSACHCVPLASLKIVPGCRTLDPSLLSPIGICFPALFHFLYHCLTHSPSLSSLLHLRPTEPLPLSSFHSTSNPFTSDTLSLSLSLSLSPLGCAEQQWRWKLMTGGWWWFDRRGRQQLKHYSFLVPFPLCCAISVCKLSLFLSFLFLCVVIEWKQWGMHHD